MRIINPVDLGYYDHLYNIIYDKCCKIAELINPSSYVLDFKFSVYKNHIVITMENENSKGIMEESDLFVPIGTFCGGEDDIKEFIEKQIKETDKAKEPTND